MFKNLYRMLKDEDAQWPIPLAFLGWVGNILLVGCPGILIPCLSPFSLVALLLLGLNPFWWIAYIVSLCLPAPVGVNCWFFPGMPYCTEMAKILLENGYGMKPLSVLFGK